MSIELKDKRVLQSDFKPAQWLRHRHAVGQRKEIARQEELQIGEQSAIQWSGISDEIHVASEAIVRLVDVDLLEHFGCEEIAPSCC